MLKLRQNYKSFQFSPLIILEIEEGATSYTCAIFELGIPTAAIF